MGKIAYIFPGQGSQYIGMGKDFYQEFEEAREIFHTVSDVLNLDMSKLIFEENDRLHLTEYTQPALVTTSLAMLSKVLKEGYEPDIYAGLSLGEFSAVIASGILDLKEGIEIVRQRGILMENAVPNGLGSMAAVLGLEKEVVEEVCSSIEKQVSIANYNCPGQIVISGEREAVQEASQILLDKGARRILPLKVSGPFHSPMLKEAGDSLYALLKKSTVNTPQYGYISNVSAKFESDPNRIRELLGLQVYSPVRWQQCVEEMIQNGVDTFVEIGPGKTLSGFVKKIDSSPKVISIEKVEELKKLEDIKK